jgi:transcriptional regulator with XRE-family HTH domain
MNIGSIITKLRRERQITQTQLARSSGITQTYLSQIENNQKEPAIPTLKSIAENLSIPLPILLFMAIESEDIPENKRKTYNIVSPSVKSLLDTLFSNDK